MNLPSKEEIQSHLNKIEEKMNKNIQLKKEEIESLDFTLVMEDELMSEFKSKTFKILDEEQYLVIVLDKATLMMELNKKIIKEGRTHKIPLLLGYLTNENIQNELNRLENEVI